MCHVWLEPIKIKVSPESPKGHGWGLFFVSIQVVTHETWVSLMPTGVVPT